MKEIDLNKSKINMRIPTDGEFDRLMDVTHEDDSLSHWRDMCSWVNAKENRYGIPASNRAVRGYNSARYWYIDGATNQNVSVGFRPAFDLEPDALSPDIQDDRPVIIGTLFMNDVPVRIPQNPTWNGDIADYTPGAKLEIRPALDDPAYQVKAFQVADGIFVADRVLLKCISFLDIEDSLLDAADSPAGLKLAEPLRLLTCGQCCDCCVRGETCADSGKVHFCSSFMPNDDFIRTLQEGLAVFSQQC